MASSDEKPDFSDVEGIVSSTAPMEQPAEQTYTVVSGDSLSKIAKKVYGDPNHWRRIFDANQDQIKDPDEIFPGQTLKIPSE
jgi:nucleoid-associated protein YgaU